LASRIPSDHVAVGTDRFVHDPAHGVLLERAQLGRSAARRMDARLRRGGLLCSSAWKE